MNHAQFHWSGRPPSEANAEEWVFHDRDSVAAYKLAIASAVQQQNAKDAKERRVAERREKAIARKAERKTEKELRHAQSIADARAALNSAALTSSEGQSDQARCARDAAAGTPLV